MTRKRYIKMLIACGEKLSSKQCRHLKGEQLKWYRDLTKDKIIYKSYSESWKNLKVLRDLVGM